MGKKHSIAAILFALAVVISGNLPQPHGMRSVETSPVLLLGAVPIRRLERETESRTPGVKSASTRMTLAKQLIQGNTNELRYACLELRLAIEALVYDTLQDYAEDNDDAVRLAYQDWQPDKVLKALSAYDPMTDTSMQITVREVALEGRPDSEKPIFIGIDDRLTTEWVAKAHRSMGSFLHQRTISQVNSGKHVDWKVLTAEARRVIERLDAILASPVHNIRSDIRFGYPCPACNNDISVAALPLMVKGLAKASCLSCGAEWDVAASESDTTPMFTRRN